MEPEKRIPGCHIANLVVTDDKARLVFSDYITGPVEFIIGTPYGDVPGNWTPDMFNCIGWSLDDHPHVLIMTYNGCTQKLIIPPKKTRKDERANN